MRDAEQTALLLALLVQRSEERRVRVSEKTFKLLSERQRLRAAFVVKVAEELASTHALCMIELDIGGFGIVHTKSLESAKAVTVKRFFTEEERRIGRTGGEFDWDAIREELGIASGMSGDDEEAGSDD